MNYDNLFIFAQVHIHELKIRAYFQVNFTVSMVTHYVEKITITCSQMLRHGFNIIIVVSRDKECFY